MNSSCFLFKETQQRTLALGEIHARPPVLLSSPRVTFQLALLREGSAGLEFTLLAALAKKYGALPPDGKANHYSMSWGPGTLRWERHTEFSTYFWDAPMPEPYESEKIESPFTDELSPPGSVISGIRLEVWPDSPESGKLVASFDPASLCYSEVRDGQAAIVTDFRQDLHGLTRILVLDRGMVDAGRGVLVQRLLDLETYRTLAMLGLPLAQELSPAIRRIEDEFTAITQRMKRHAREEADAMLSDITRLAAELEANAASSLYRFGASRAYYHIVQERIQTLAETPMPGQETLGLFLSRRLAPAMRTCQSVEERQENMARKLERATALLRSWIDVELERLNSGLLGSMNLRAKHQLRLQQTVEGLSVAAISYYVVGLVGYIAKAAYGLGLPVSPETLMGISVPVVVLGIWATVRAIRNRHMEEHVE